MGAEHLRFAPEILRRLGEELVPHADLGILELVRNAYDADASFCVVSLDGVEETGGTVVIRDDGDGMSEADIKSGWLLLGKSAKVGERFTPGGRRKVGEKGLGRLAALRLGRHVTLTTRRELPPSAAASLADPVAQIKGSATVESKLSIDWDLFEDVESVDQVPLSIQTRSSNEPKGSEISISDLRKPLSKPDVRRLARSMVLLTGPFPAPNIFRARLDAPGFEEMERLVLDGYFEEHDYIIRAKVDSQGWATAILIDWNGQILGTASHDDLANNGSAYECPPADFELWVFTLSKASFDVRNSTQPVSAVQNWLREIGGVHLFQRGLRVHPYGDAGHDWLDMNLRRARSPEMRPSTNTSIGRIVVHDDGDQLTPKTDRTGFIENASFADLRQFGGDVLDWAAEVRLRLREAERLTDREKNQKALTRATTKVSKALKNVPEDVRPTVENAIVEYQAAFNRQLRSTEDDLLLYRTLGTVGTMTAVFAHETLRPVATIQQMASSIRVRIHRAVGTAEYDRTFAVPIDRIENSSLSLRTFAEWPLHLLSRSKRRRGVVDVARTARDVLNLFDPYLRDTGVSARVEDREGERALVAGTRASWEAVFANLLANSVYFLGQAPTLSNREVLVTIDTSEKNVIVTVSDSGLGLVDISPSDVWLPGRSTREDGTGLGLTIVRDAVRDMGGTISAVANCELGGAEFRLIMPKAEDDGALPGLEER
ncbi:histidine kinase [Nocardioides sp. HDW12B]|uniref:ATP-binding protein n=1 Tax=Nocardioides sp. HDW12B TaxID=2714939 RepID=UPI00140DC68E|nr:ATP-binding protein [Nocardioides sp. HDW12B]QIK66833.1 histidine kinase [Nocardioides sp. HDW12B]